MYGDKEATLNRFKENYRTLSERVKKRLVLENDDMCWSVEDLLPTCQELGIPMVLVSSPSRSLKLLALLSVPFFSIS
jgi:UV DNA damage endonuclease